MRSGIPIFLALTACSTSATEAPDSVRDQLESSEVQLVVAPAARAGSITALRRVSGGWVEGQAPLTVEGGELVAASDARGAIRIERLALDLGPIEIPPSVLGYAARLTEVHLETERPAGVATTWKGDDEARAMAPMQLALTWSLTIDGQTSPLGSPRLAPVPVELLLTGDGAAVHAEVHARAAGAIWSWANLLRLEDLELSITASTTASTTASAVAL